MSRWLVALAALLISCLAAATPAVDLRERIVDEPVFGGRVRIVEAGDASGPTVVLIHGLGASASADWQALLPGLGGRYRLLMFDLPGFGGSTAPDAAFSPSRYAELTHWIVERFAGGRPLAVIGHSLGGAVALNYAYRYPDGLDRLLLIDAAGILQRSSFTRHLLRLPEARGAFSGPLRGLSAIGNAAGGVLLDWADRVPDPARALHSSRAARKWLLRDDSAANAALGLVGEDFSPMPRAIATPVWLLWGERDAVAPVRTGRALHALLPRSELTVLPGVGHVPMRDATEATLAWVGAALDASPPAAAREDELPAAERDGECAHASGQRFSGSWRRLRLKKCGDVVIENARIGRLEVYDSVVALQNVTITAPAGTAVVAEESVIEMTDVRVVAQRFLGGRGSRFDLAAVRLWVGDWGDWSGHMRLTASLSQWCEGGHGWRVHGLWPKAEAPFEPALRRTDDGCAGPPPHRTEE